MYHYNDPSTRDNTNHHSLGRPASMPSLYSNSYHPLDHNQKQACNMNLQEEKSGHQDTTNASHGWHQHNNGWNHNNECNSKSSPPLTPLPPSSSINNNSISNHLSFHSSFHLTNRLQQQHELLPSINQPYEQAKTMSSPSNTNGTSTASNNMISAYNSPTYFVSPSTTTATTSAYPTTTPSHSHPYSPYYGSNTSNTNNTSSSNNHTMPYQSRHSLVARPKLTTTLWEDEGTICYQVDANGICVARRQDNDMINGTKLLNVAGMSRGKRDGILKNEKGRVVVKVGAMHLKGVWITFARAKLLAAQYKIQEILYPLFVDDPSVFLYATALHNPMSSSRMNSLNGYNNRQQGLNYNNSPYQQWDRQLSSIHHDNNSSSYRNVSSSIMNNGQHGDMFMLSSQQGDGVDYNNRSSLPAYGNHHSSLSHSNSSYSLYGQQQDNNNPSGRPRSMYFTNELLDDDQRHSHDIKSEPLSDSNSSPYYGHNNKMLPGTNTLASPTPSEAGKSSSAFHLPPSRTSGEYDSTSSITSGTTASTNTTANERRQSLVMSGGSRVASPRHHPYMSPGKVYTPSIMSTLQSYRSDYSTTKEGGNEITDRNTTNELENTTQHDMNKPW